MKNALRGSCVLALGLTLIASMAFAKAGKKHEPNYGDYQINAYQSPTSDYRSEQQALAATAAANTTILGAYNFDASPTTCTAQGWTGVDLSTVSPLYWHIDDYSGLPAADYAPIRGSKSLWCGTRANNPDGLVCSYESAPGYGNNWDQTWSMKSCVAVVGNVDVAMIAQWSSHYTYCGWSIEYTADCSNSGNEVWKRLYGGVGPGTGATPDGLTDLDANVPVDFDSFLVVSKPVVPAAGPVKVRLRFQSQHAYSDEDGVYPTNGAVHVDSLTVEGGMLEEFEDEVVGATSSNDWIAGKVNGFGNYMATFPGTSIAQDDPCRKDLSCVWAAINNSPFFGGCIGKPAQRVVPLMNQYGAYIHNEIWSPKISLAGTAGSVLNMEFTVYVHLPLANLVFYVWRVRQYDTGNPCPKAWHDINFVYYSNGTPAWGRAQSVLAPLLDLSNASDVQVGLGVLDNCRPWCGGAATTCHTQAPLFDTVRVYRVEADGPQWTVRDSEQFQDNFAETTGDWAGFVRADGAATSNGYTTPGIVPYDSAVVYSMADPEAGLALDGTGKPKAYIYVATWPQGQANKTGAALTQDPARFPWVGTTTVNSIVWDIVRLDTTDVLDKYCIDLNDCLWEPGDTICFWYSAENTNGVKTYLGGSALTLQVNTASEAATYASEFTCLPAGGAVNGDILYVDCLDGRGGQPYFDTAFQSLGLLDDVDRFDVRGPSSDVANRLGSRVNDITQLTGNYRKIIWDSGDLTVGIGDGVTGATNHDKSPDTLILKQFLDGLTNPGGLYFCGDDQPSRLQAFTGTAAANFKAYIRYSLSNPNGGDHYVKGFPINPLINTDPAGCFAGDTFFAYGGCNVYNDFDVMTPTGDAVSEGSYGAPTGGVWTPEPINSAIVSDRTVNPQTVSVGVILSGFGFSYIRDDENDGISDRAKHLHDIITWLGNTPPQPTGTGAVASNSLSQNYPNPFNPQTTIAFSVKERGLVNLKVYNVAGQLVRTLANEQFAAGAHTKVWDGRNDAGQAVSSGVYFYKLVANNFTQTKKMVLLK